MRAVQFNCDVFCYKVIVSAEWAEFCYTSAVKTFSTAICHYARLKFSMNRMEEEWEEDIACSALHMSILDSNLPQIQ